MILDANLTPYDEALRRTYAGILYDLVRGGSGLGRETWIYYHYMLERMDEYIWYFEVAPTIQLYELHNKIIEPRRAEELGGGETSANGMNEPAMTEHFETFVERIFRAIEVDAKMTRARRRASAAKRLRRHFAAKRELEVCRRIANLCADIELMSLQEADEQRSRERA